jgi:hypothetical protein
VRPLPSPRSVPRRHVVAQLGGDGGGEPGHGQGPCPLPRHFLGRSLPAAFAQQPWVVVHQIRGTRQRDGPDRDAVPRRGGAVQGEGTGTHESGRGRRGRDRVHRQHERAGGRREQCLHGRGRAAHLLHDRRRRGEPQPLEKHLGCRAEQRVRPARHQDDPRHVGKPAVQQAARRDGQRRHVLVRADRAASPRVHPCRAVHRESGDLHSPLLAVGFGARWAATTGLRKAPWRRTRQPQRRRGG